jgi:hypothetical protein
MKKNRILVTLFFTTIILVCLYSKLNVHREPNYSKLLSFVDSMGNLDLKGNAESYNAGGPGSYRYIGKIPDNLMGDNDGFVYIKIIGNLDTPDAFFLNSSKGRELVVLTTNTAGKGIESLKMPGYHLTKKVTERIYLLKRGT